MQMDKGIHLRNLRALIAEELHKNARRNFLTRRVEIKGLNDLFQADLCDMQGFNERGYRYILTVINCFSKKAYATPLKTKAGLEVTKALKPIFLKNKVNNFQTDHGREFYNTHCIKLYEKYGINHYSSFTDKKASIVERFNRTLKGLMWREFTSVGNYKWVSLLPKLIERYNNTVHRTTGMKPNKVNKHNEKRVLQAINTATYRRKVPLKQKFSVNDSVRVSKYKHIFRKGYLPSWSNEIFTIHRVMNSRPITYILRDYEGDVIEGAFYEQELMKTNHKDTFLVEKVIRRRGNKVLVRWLGFDSRHDSWISKDNIL